MTAVDRLLREAREIAACGGPAGLAAWLPTVAGTLELPAGTSVAEARRVVLGELPGGPALGLRWFPPGQATDVHGHGGWGVIHVLEGTDRYERWESTSDSQARLAEVRFLGAGDTVWFGDPPDDLHRQVGTGSGALELVVLQSHEARRQAYAMREQPHVDEVSEAILAYDWPAITGLYRDTTVLEMNVPRWRFQLRGPREVLDYARREAPLRPRLTAARVTHGPDSVTVEVEFHDGGHLWREVHIAHTAQGRIISHTVYCTGIWTPDDIARQAAEAPMVRC